MVRAALSLGTTTCERTPVLAGLAGSLGWSPGLRTKAADAAFAVPLACVPLVAAHCGTSTVRMPLLACNRSVVAPGDPMRAPVAGALHGVTTTVRGWSVGTTTARNEPTAKKLFGGLFFFDSPTMPAIARTTTITPTMTRTVRLRPTVCSSRSLAAAAGLLLHQTRRRAHDVRLRRRAQDVALARLLLAARAALSGHARRHDHGAHVAVVRQHDLVGLRAAAGRAARRAAGALHAARRHEDRAR